MELEYSLDEVKEVATRLWNGFNSSRIFAFHGQMGAGKTTLINALCDVKQVKDTVSSPTFSIINEYLYEESGYARSIYHIDLYRLKDEDEAIRAGVEDCIFSGQICLVEWPERAPGLLPPDTIHLHFEVLDEGRRRLKINGN
jgi:tRNA threonylcarbamoyladenosine biosynthesis protein TsaE